MSSTRRNTLAIALVAVAICADRAMVASTQPHRGDRVTLAGNIVRKLQISLRRIVPAVNLLRERAAFAASPVAGVLAVVTCPDFSRPLVSLLESRLPPPGC
jgi:hypothetical protein